MSVAAKRGFVALVAVGVALVIAGVARSDAAATDATPARHVGPQGRVGQFVVKCVYSHSAPDDPIVHYGHAGRSHQHDFYGATTTNASSTVEELAGAPTTCDKRADTAAYWHPALLDGGELVEPTSLHAYYRAAPGVDPTTVRPFPFGLALIAGNAAATELQPGEAAGWVCGSSTTFRATPPECTAGAPLHMLLTFPDCWDGSRLDSADHKAHATYSIDGDCPPSHPVAIPQLTVSAKFPIYGPAHDLSLASGGVETVHGDFFNAWDPEGLAREVEQCINNDVVCDLASNREEEGPFLHREKLVLALETAL